MRSIFVAILALSAVAATAETPAFASSNLSRINGDALPEDADRRYGAALTAALVYADGTFAKEYSSGVISTKRTGTGAYEVAFNRTLVGCAAVATSLIDSAVVGIYDIGGSKKDTWLINVRDVDGAASNTGFTIINFCSR